MTTEINHSKRSEILNSILSQFFTEYDEDHPYIFLNSLSYHPSLDNYPFVLQGAYEDFNHLWLHEHITAIYNGVIAALESKNKDIVSY